MNDFVYRGVDGELYREGHVDRHHVFPQSKMRNHNEREWNRLGGLVLPMVKRYHNDGKESLHANVPLAPKPERELMFLLRLHIYEQDPLENVYDRFLSINERIHDIADNHRDIGLAANASRIARNFELQTPFILQGMVERIEVKHGQ